LGVLREFAPDAAPKRDGCYREAARLYQELAHQEERTTDGLYALLFLALCQKNTAQFTEARETLRDALQHLDRMSDGDLNQSRVTRRSREDWRRRLQTELDQVP
jgi:hypothetical protein